MVHLLGCFVVTIFEQKSTCSSPFRADPGEGANLCGSYYIEFTGLLTEGDLVAVLGLTLTLLHIDFVLDIGETAGEVTGEVEVEIVQLEAMAVDSEGAVLININRVKKLLGDILHADDGANLMGVQDGHDEATVGVFNFSVNLLVLAVLLDFLGGDFGVIFHDIFLFLLHVYITDRSPILTKKI